MAKKNGTPNIEFPSKYFNFIELYLKFKSTYNNLIIGIELTQIVSKINYSRFALVVEKSSMFANPSLSAQSFYGKNGNDYLKHSVAGGVQQPHDILVGSMEQNMYKTSNN